MKRIICVPYEIQADIIIGILKKQGIHAMKRYMGLGGGSFGYSAFAVEVYVYEADLKEALEIVSGMDQSLAEEDEEELEELAENAAYSEENEDEDLSFGQWRIKKAEFGWKVAPGHIKRFIISEEEKRFKRCVCNIYIICTAVLALLCLGIYTFELSDLENIRYRKAKAEYYAENPRIYAAERDNRSPKPNRITRESTIKNRYLLVYIFLIGVALSIANRFKKMYYDEFNDFRTQTLRICYGRCIGKESVYARAGSYFSVDLCLDDKTVLKGVPVREKVCRNVETGDLLMLANIEGHEKGPEPVDEIDGVYYYPEYKEKRAEI